MWRSGGQSRIGIFAESGEHLHLTANNRFSSALSASQSLIASGFGASFVSAGTTPSFFCRSSVCSRSLSQPWSNWPLYLAFHSLGTWCGAWVAPGAKYMKNGLSGVSDFSDWTHAIAWFVMSVMKW